MTMNVMFADITVYMLVFARMGGMLFFNPLLSRKSVPASLRVALVLGITVLIAPLVGDALPPNLSEFALVAAMMRELLMGAACGFAFQLFYHMLFAVGDIIDNSFGLAMAKIFDPSSNIQMSMTGNVFQLIFIMYFFATDSHLTFIKLMASSYDLVGIGAVTIGGNVGSFIINLFVNVFSLVMQMALPFIAACFILELAMGILMKLISQVNVFSVHFQFKIAFGLVLLFAFIEPTAFFLKEYVDIMFRSIQNLISIV